MGKFIEFTQNAATVIILLQLKHASFILHETSITKLKWKVNPGDSPAEVQNGSVNDTRNGQLSAIWFLKIVESGK